MNVANIYGLGFDLTWRARKKEYYYGLAATFALSRNLLLQSVYSERLDLLEYRGFRSEPRNYIGMAFLVYYVMYPTRFAGVFFSSASRALIIERIARSLRIASVRQAWPIRPKIGLDSETKSSPPFLYSSLVVLMY